MSVYLLVRNRLVTKPVHNMFGGRGGVGVYMSVSENRSRFMNCVCCTLWDSWLMYTIAHD